MKFAEDIGKIHFAMRSKKDLEPRADDKDRFKSTDMPDFLGEEDEAEPQPNDDDLEQFLDANTQPDSLPEPIPVAQVACAPVAVPTGPEVPAFDSSWRIEFLRELSNASKRCRFLNQNGLSSSQKL